MHFPRPNLVISSCLGVLPVRYDGNIITDDFVELLKKYVDIVPVCPEVGIGLGVPRNPIVISRVDGIDKLVEPKSGTDYTLLMESFATRFLEGVASIDGFLLKASSPSCGVSDAKVYGKGGFVLGKSDGLFTRVVRLKYPFLPIESEKRLLDPSIRWLFLTRLFSIADMRVCLRNDIDLNQLVSFHRRYKYLLLLFSPNIQKRLGNLVARAHRSELTNVISTYRSLFLMALSKKPSRGKFSDVFLHIYSHFKKKLVEAERRYLLDIIDRYRQGKESFYTVLTYLQGFAYRFSSEYLAEQKFLNPFPNELMSSDSF